ncbi:MAG: site-2 protease family protein [Planctomycetia bacterium]
MVCCLIAAETWIGWLLDPASWWVILLVAGGLGFVIFVHELGHFLVAKACGVKCEKFYLGFDVGGLKLCSFKWGETEYGIGALPLGGYVKMLGQDDNPAAAATEAERARGSGDLSSTPMAAAETVWDPRSYPAQSVPERMAIISAGVIMNVIFAVLMASLAYGLGVREQVAVLAGTRAGGAAWRAGLRTGDEITSVAGRQDPMFEDLIHAVTVGSVKQGVELTVRRPADGSMRTLTLKPDIDLGKPTLGISGPRSLTLPVDLKEPLPGSAGRARPAFQGGDVVTAVNGREVGSYAELIAAIAPQPDKPITLTVRRTGDKPAAAARELDVVLEPQLRRVTGLAMTAGAIKAVQEGSPAATSGLQAGDRIVTVAGEPVGDPLTLDDRLRRAAGGRVQIEVDRAGKTVSVEVEPRPVTWIESNLISSLAAVPAIGVALAVEAVVTAVDAEGPAAAAEVQVGDRVVAVRVDDPAAKGKTKGTTLKLTDDNQCWPMVEEELQYLDAGKRLVLTIVPADGGKPRDVDVEPAPARDRFVVDRGLFFKPVERTFQARSLGAALSKGTRKAFQGLSMVYGFLQKLVQNQISPRLLGGPITIARQAAMSAEDGFSSLLLFLTMLSANLAVVNFLPIPVLDGGHMVFLLYEWIRGKPPSEGVVAVLSYLGLALILTLMVFVFGLDLGLIPRR